MKDLRYTLLSDGSSDKALLPILTWLLQQYVDNFAIQAERADLTRLPSPPKTLEERIKWSLQLYPCDILFVHRDAEKQSYKQRQKEINLAFENVKTEILIEQRIICIIPIRMTEAWLFFDEIAIRRAAGNPNGTMPLTLPNPKNLEKQSDPKEELHAILKTASELTGRKLKKLNIHQRVHRISEFIEDFSPLRQLRAFQALEEEIRQSVDQFDPIG